MSHGLVCSEVNLALVPENTWWLDSRATTNISVSMKDCLNYRKPNDVEIYIYMGNGKSVEVEVVGHFRLLMCTKFYLDLKGTFVVSSFRRNLISVSYLHKLGFFVHLETICSSCLSIQIFLELVHLWVMIVYICLTQ